MNKLNNELINLAGWVAELMIKDKVKADQITTDLIMAYIDEVGKKKEKIKMLYITRPEAKKYIYNLMFNALKNPT